MLLLTSHVNAPGHCRLCQSAVVPVVDTQRDYDSDGIGGGGGALKICANCVGTMASLMGWVHPSAKEDFEERIERLEAELDGIQTEAADLAAENETLKAAFAVVGPDAPAKRGPGRPRKVAQ